MKKLVLFVGLFLSISCWENVFAQNKTLGVGVATPNPNAALHVESPTGNQGFVMPRLTTMQRNAMSSLLTLTDNGLMLFDTDLKTIFIWDGTLWKSTAQVAGGPKLIYPYVDTVTISPGANANLLRLVYAGSATENVGVAHFENLNPNSGFSAVFGRTNSATNGVADFIVDNTANNNDAISVNTNGVGTAGRFRTNNKGAKNPALWVETNSDSALSGAIYGLNTGTGDPAGIFRISNTASNVAALFAETNGGGPSIFGNQIGLGRAGQFQIGNAANNNAVVRAFTSGTGYSGFYTINNVESTSAGVFSTTNGRGAAIYGENTGTLDGFAGLFNVTQATNTFPAIQASTVGSGSGVRVFQDIGTGAGMDVFMRNATTKAPGFSVDHQGLGNAGNFTITNGSSSGSALYSATTGIGSAANFTVNNTTSGAPALLSSTTGTGAAFQAQTSSGFTAVYGRREGPTNGNAGLFDITDASNTFPSLQVNTIGTGPAGSFVVNNISSTVPALNAMTNGTGPALFANHTGSSGSIALFQSNDTSVVRIDKTGKGFFNGGTQLGGADVAEMFDVEGNRNTYEPGDVLVISEMTDRTVEKSNKPNSTRVVGVYATKPGVLLTEKGIDENIDNLVPMGVIGVIPTKVCLENGPIKRGDLLVTSSATGHAMKAIPANVGGVLIYPTGAIIGKALENFDGTQSGLIKVLVNVK